MMKRSLLLPFAFLLLTSPAWAEPVGMAARITGKAEVQIGGKRSSLRLLQRLEAGQIVRCGAGAEAVIVLFGNGQRYKIGAGSSGTIGAANVSGAQMLAAAGGPSQRVAMALGGSRVGAVMARPAPSYKRLKSDNLGWLTPDETGKWHFAWDTRLSWDEFASATKYSFSLLDANDDVIFIYLVPGSEVSMILPNAQLRRPYVWRLLPQKENGKAVGSLRWGVITFLSRADYETLSQAAAPLEAELKENPRDAETLALLAELYRSYGVLNRTLELLDSIRELYPVGSDEAKAALQASGETFQQISPYAYGQWLILQADKTQGAGDVAITTDAK